MADHPLRSATDRRLGGLLSHQLANQTRVHLIPPEFFTPCHATLCAYAVLPAVSSCYPPVQGRLPTRYSPVRHSVIKNFKPLNSFTKTYCLGSCIFRYSQDSLMNHFKILKEFQGCLSIQLSKNFIKCYQLFLADSLIRISLPFLFVKNFFTFLSYFFKATISCMSSSFTSTTCISFFVQYAHKHLWQIKSHSCLMNGLSGEDGIRTHAPVKTNGFQDRPVMTTSVPLHSYFLLCRTSDLIILSSQCNFVNSFFKVF